MFLRQIVFIVLTINICRANYSNKWLIKGDLTYEEIHRTAERFGFQVLKKLRTEHYVLTRDDVSKYSRHRSDFHTKLLKEHGKISFVKQEQWTKVNRRAINLPPQDEKWKQMWYINEMTNVSLGILQAWKSNYTGKGVAISIVDDGVDYKHIDLINRYDSVHSKDVYDDDGDPTPIGKNFSHGTKCAGMALATSNKDCVVGVAPEANLIAIRMIGPRGVLPSGQIEGLDNEFAHISSNSWGGVDLTFDEPSSQIKEALKVGVTKGRSGKGVVYVFAGGNGGFDDNCNTDGYVNSIYTIGINSVTIDNDYPGYAEPCTAILASAYSGNSFSDMCATDINQGCVTDFTGTSASAPLASGLLALVLQAKPDLHWRDIQELIVRTSKTGSLKYGEFKTNALGRKVSDWFGYGLLDANNLIKTARNWTSLPKQNMCDRPFETVNSKINKGDKSRIIEKIVIMDGCNDTWKCVNSIEHVEVQVKFDFTQRGAVELKIQSPSGTESRLLRPRNGDTATDGTQDWTYMSVQHWGENPIGSWKLIFSMNSNINAAGTLIGWKLILYGTGVGCTKPRKPGQKSKKSGTSPEHLKIIYGVIGGVSGCCCCLGAGGVALGYKKRKWCFKTVDKNKVKSKQHVHCHTDNKVSPGSEINSKESSSNLIANILNEDT
ncbi:furin-1-like isoform X2 [Ruditapes philippinarum]|uniref:furin-1-like isoform X2 n=1 Tax=Ruditapes philippinarum TaxID=129788 RepID=UPI00295AD7EF|nr:furin-1-like isoform X2 [Ruditapes philippinarum]